MSKQFNARLSPVTLAQIKELAEHLTAKAASGGLPFAKASQGDVVAMAVQAMHDQEVRTGGLMPEKKPKKLPRSA